MDLNYLFYAIMIFFSAGTVINIAHLVRAGAKAKAAGGSKTYLHISFFFTIIFGVIFAVFAARCFNNMAICNRNVQKTELAVSTGRAEALCRQIEKDTGESITDPEVYLKKYIDTNRQLGLNARFGGVFSVIAAIFAMSLSVSSFYFFSDKGVITSKWKEIQPVTATRREGKVDVFLKTDLANGKSLLTIRDTPKNLSMLGRYIEFESADSTERSS